MKPKSQTNEKRKNVIEDFLHQYLPYWPLFLILFGLAGFGGYTYLKYATPVYEINANILIKDEKKGADDTKILEALNIYTTTKIVENEIEVIQSKELLKEVVIGLSLYAPIFEDGSIRSVSAYTTSPIIIELKNPEAIKNTDRIDFSYSKKKNVVKLRGKTYPLNMWVPTSFGIARFSPNPNKNAKPARKKFYFSLSTPKKVVSQLVDNLKATPASKLSTVINLVLYDEVPERGENILNRLIDVYNEAALNDKNQFASNTLRFVEERIKLVVKELDSVETKLQDYRTRSGVINLSEQGKMYLQNVGDNDRKMTDLNMQAATLNEVEEYVLAKDNQTDNVSSIAGIKDPLLSQLLQTLLESQTQYEKLRKTVPAGNPTMLSLKTQIENLRPTILENIRNQKNNLKASIENLNAGTGMYASILKSIPKKERDLLDISRQQAIKNDAYSFLLQKREETALSYAAVVSDSRTINHATASFQPVSPKKSFIYLVSAVLALILGLSFIIMKELLTHKIQFRSDIERLTSIPVAAEVIKVKGSDADIINNNSRQLSFIEQFRQLRASIALNGRHFKHRKILVTSSIEGEGKSFIGNNLALSLTLSGKKVVMIDLDLRHPKTTSLYKLQGKKGVADFLEDSTVDINSILYPTANEKLSIIPAGYSDINPTELLLSGDIEKLFGQLEKMFDFILVDTCPIDPVTDAYILSDYCDSTIFVVRHNYTPKAMVELLEETHKINALKNIFIVFNGIKSRGFFNKRYGYGYGYGRKKVYGEHVYKTESVRNKV